MPPSPAPPPPPAPLEVATLLLMPADLPPPDLDPGVVTSGLCATPEAQAEFDANQAGRPALP